MNQSYFSKRESPWHSGLPHYCCVLGCARFLEGFNQMSYSYRDNPYLAWIEQRKCSSCISGKALIFLASHWLRRWSYRRMLVKVTETTKMCFATNTSQTTARSLDSIQRFAFLEHCHTAYLRTWNLYSWKRNDGGHKIGLRPIAVIRCNAYSSQDSGKIVNDVCYIRMGWSIL